MTSRPHSTRSSSCLSARRCLPQPCLTRAAAVLLVGGALMACGATVRPVDPATQIDRRPATQLVLELDEPCEVLPGGAPRVRPNSIPAYHVLPAGSYRPELEDGDGVYFASPSGVSLIEP